MSVKLIGLFILFKYLDNLVVCSFTDFVAKLDNVNLSSKLIFTIC